MTIYSPVLLFQIWTSQLAWNSTLKKWRSWHPASLSSVQLLSHVRLSAKPWTAAHQTSLSITNSWNLPTLMSIESVMPSTISSSLIPFSSCLQSFPGSGFFPMSWLFTSGGQSTAVSASVFPKNIQGWFPLGFTGLISLLSKGLSRIFSNTTVWEHQFFSPQPSLWSNSIYR